MPHPTNIERHPLRRPWMDLSQAEAKEIAAVIDRCPSKALQYELKDPIRIVYEEAKRQSALMRSG